MSATPQSPANAANSATSAPYGAWPSPLGAALVAAGATPLLSLALGADGAVYWLAGRASEAGRQTLLRRRGALAQDITPRPLNVRTRVHEYGGGAYAVHGDTVYFSHFADNRLYRIAAGTGCASALAADGAGSNAGAGDRGAAAANAGDHGATAVPFTAPGRQRFADFVVDAARRRLLAVRELHAEASIAPHAQPVNTLCAVGFDGTETVLASGHDFYSSPRLSPDGSRLAWLTWDHPRMPWQGTELWLAAVLADGTLDTPRLVAGGPEESICQPEWAPDGRLYFVSDRSGWWNLYRHDEGREAHAICPMEAEFATPHWTFGNALYGFAGATEIVCSYIEQGVSRLARLDIDSGVLSAIATPYQEIRELRVGAGPGPDAHAGEGVAGGASASAGGNAGADAGTTFIALLGGSPTIPLELARIELARGAMAGGTQILARSIDDTPAAGYLSVPQSISYPSAGGRSSHAFFYPPANRDVRPDDQGKPPVIVISHGGPTGMTVNTLKLATQFWTSRGFGVLDVNYGGSTGFGRAYRDALKGQWGVVDVEDCIAGAQYLVERGLADGERLIIRGGSAGGLTTLCALTFHDVFKLGASYYGVSDLKGLDLDSHKFESHYNAYLIAPQPQADALYLARSPIHHTDRLTRPMIFFQGLDDKVVPPQQSEAMVAALRQRGVPVAYVPLAGEGHGFRKAENIVRTLEAELYFYQRMFGLHDGATAPAVEIDNL